MIWHLKSFPPLTNTQTILHVIKASVCVRRVDMEEMMLLYDAAPYRNAHHRTTTTEYNKHIHTRTFTHLLSQTAIFHYPWGIVQ